MTTTEKTVDLDLRVNGLAREFVQAMAEGQAREIALLGPRGERKTSHALVAMYAHAVRHAEAGFDLPVIWMGVTDTFEAHRRKTIRSMEQPHWKGAWRISDNDHVARFRAEGTDWVHIDLFGIEDKGAMDRVRAECHGVWFEEPAPSAVLIQSSGISETAWDIAITSQRLPSHCHPAMMTLNYPDEDHWTWRRFFGNPTEGLEPVPGTKAFQIPAGTYASASDRAEWERALAGRPDLLRRLIVGLPGTVLLGVQVAQGFREDRHMAPTALAPMRDEPLFFGWDGGHTPTVSIGQQWRGSTRVYAAPTEERGGMRQLISRQVIPWLTVHAPWVLQKPALMLHGYDPSVDTDSYSDIEQNPLKVIEQMLGGVALPGPVAWSARISPLLTLLNQMIDGEPALRLDPKGCGALKKALSGSWHYPMDRMGKVSRDLPKKPNHPWEDLGDSLLYLICRMGPERKVKPVHRHTNKERAMSYAVR